MQSIQRADKGWAPYSAGNPIGAASSVLATTYTLFELRAARDGVPSGADCPTVSSLDTAINDGIGWLIGKRKPDGGFGDEAASAVLGTALAYKTLKAVCTGTPVYSQCPASITIETAVDYLLAQQRPDGQAHAGSWGSDALLTALVLNVMSTYPATRPQAAILLDTDGDGIPDSVEPLMGKNPNVADSGFPSSGGTASSLQVYSVVDGRTFAGRSFRIDLFALGGTPPYSWQMVSGAPYLQA